MAKAWNPNSLEFLILNYLGEYDRTSLKSAIEKDVNERADFYHTVFDETYKQTAWFSNAALTAAARKLANEKFIVETSGDFSLAEKGLQEWNYLKNAFKNEIIFPGWTKTLL